MNADNLAEKLRAALNPPQFEAATKTEGPLLILAGAGSGKTRVLVHRAQFILDTGLARPHELLMVTFTNKAAGEMRERLAHLIGPQINQAWIGTFHALSGRMLRQEGHRLGYDRNFSIYDTDDQKRLLKNVAEEMQLDPQSEVAPLSAIQHEIDRAKNAGLLPQAFLEKSSAFDTPAKKLTRAVYPRYQAALRKANAMDFGDLLLLARELLVHHPDAHRRFAERFRYVMVDEFQDTNLVQYDLLKALVSIHGNLAVVGDDDQSIYRWRGAEVSNILDFPQTFANTTVVKLEQNYRSTGTILEAANAIIRNNQRRHQKTLYTDAQAGEQVGLAMLNTGEEEAELVARVVKKKLDEGSSPEDFAILYRQNAQSRAFEEALRRHRLPYTLIGGTSFYERMEVKDILAYLRLLANPRSRQDFERIANVPGRGLGDKTLEKLRAAAEHAEQQGGPAREGVELLEVSDTDFEAVGIGAAAKKKLRELRKLLRELAELAQTAPASEIARAVIERTGYEKYLDKNDPLTAEDRRANVAELVNAIAEHESATDLEDALAGARTPLEDFLDRTALVSTADLAASTGNVSLLTLHAAKGLEFPVVFLVGMEEGTFPPKRVVDDGSQDDVEEERRLCYVGMTRAKQQLYLLAARVRRIYGRDEVRWPSRFLGELPDTVVANLGGNGQMRPVRRPVAQPQQIVRPPDDLPVYQQTSRELGPGSHVFHNTFGVGVVEGVDGAGPNARLEIRFPEVGVRKVVARFVRAAGGS